MRVGLFFGSFNPIHHGHLIIANSLVQEGYVEQVWLVVSPQNPFKSQNELAPFEHRLKMCRLATEGQSHIQVSDIESRLPQPSYTYRTLETLQAQYPKHDFALIMGSDTYATVPLWKKPDYILKHMIVVYPRPHHELYALFRPHHLYLRHLPLLHISATTVRNYVQKGRDITYFVPEKVRDYILTHRLYTVPAQP